MTTAVVTRALVAGVRPLGAYRVVALQAPDVAAAARAGQFVNVGLDPGSGSILRRPFSVYRAHPGDGLVEIALAVVGPGTEWIAARAACTEVEIVGPLGTPFELPRPGAHALLVGGGYGTAVLAQLAAELRAAGCTSHLIAGAATAARVLAPEAHLFDAVGVTTEDGSAGERGLVTDAMPAAIARHRPAAVYACGPMGMLAAVSAVAAEHGLPARVAAEEFMACGIGVCWTCVVPVRTDGGISMVRCCTEGPVFDGAAVAW